MRSSRLVWGALALLFLLHNDFWFWNDGRLILGLPVGLLYHLGFCFAASGLFALLVRSGLEDSSVASEGDSQ